MENRLRYHIRVLNISVGIGESGDRDRMEELAGLLDAVCEQGVVVICAAGNKGPNEGSLSPLGESRRVITVGCHEGGYFGARKDLCENYSGIKENSERLLNITGELLNMIQVESGKLQLKPKITKPIELIEYAIKANRVQAEKFNIQIEVEYPDDKISRLFVDSEKIAWVLTNLLSNAIRYSPENGRLYLGLLFPWNDQCC